MISALLVLAACQGGDPDKSGNNPKNTDKGTDTDTDTPTTDTSTTDTDTLGPPPLLAITEVMAKNQSGVQLDDLSFPDWVELTNVGEEEIDLSLITLEDSSGDEWEGSGVLAAGASFVVYADELEGEDHAPFKVDDEGDELILRWQGQIIDELSIEGGVLDDDLSLAWLDEGSGADWVVTARPTPGEENTGSETLVPATETWFTREEVHQLTVTLTPEAYSQLDSGGGWGGGGEQEVRAQIDIDGVYIEDIGFRLKGSASFDNMNGKPAFKVDINQGHPGRRFRGLKAFNLHNGNVLDPTRVRDHISYTLARESGLMAPRVGWAEVIVSSGVQDFYYGIYMIIEQHDDEMIQHWFPGQEETAYLFEPNEGSGDFGQSWGGGGGNVDFDQEEGPVPMEEDARRVLSDVDDIVERNASDENIEAFFEHVEKEPFLNYMAWEALTNHTDGYKAPNNWRLFLNADTRKLQWVPAGAEWTWDYTPDIWYSNGNAVDFCLSNAQCTRDYAEVVLEMADRVEDLDLATQFQEISIWLDPIIDMDPRSPHSTTKVNNARRTTGENIEANPNRARNAVYSRFPDLQP